MKVNDIANKPLPMARKYHPLETWPPMRRASRTEEKVAIRAQIITTYSIRWSIVLNDAGAEPDNWLITIDMKPRMASMIVVAINKSAFFGFIPELFNFSIIPQVIIRNATNAKYENFNGSYMAGIIDPNRRMANMMET